MMTKAYDSDVEAIDLKRDLNYRFAISQIDPRLGRIVVNQVDWPSKFPGSGGVKKELVPIEMVECDNLREYEGS